MVTFKASCLKIVTIHEEQNNYFFRLVSLFAAYLLFGFLYQRFVLHAKGFEQIPNFSFWKKCGNMSAVSCFFIEFEYIFNKINSVS